MPRAATIARLRSEAAQRCRELLTELTGKPFGDPEFRELVRGDWQKEVDRVDARAESLVRALVAFSKDPLPAGAGDPARWLREIAKMIHVPERDEFAQSEDEQSAARVAFTLEIPRSTLVDLFTMDEGSTEKLSASDRRRIWQDFDRENFFGLERRASHRELALLSLALGETPLIDTDAQPTIASVIEQEAGAAKQWRKERRKRQSNSA